MTPPPGHCTGVPAPRLLLGGPTEVEPALVYPQGRVGRDSGEEGKARVTWARVPLALFLSPPPLCQGSRILFSPFPLELLTLRLS